MRTSYSEFVSGLDDQFDRLIGHLDQNGLHENSYGVFTSDHGELFERGASGYSTPLMFDPLDHITLVVGPPGQREQVDLRSLTSNVDLLPTLLRSQALKFHYRPKKRRYQA